MTKQEIRDSWDLFKVKATIYIIFALIWLRTKAAWLAKLEPWLARKQEALEDSLPKPPPPPNPLWRSDGQVHNRNALSFPRNMSVVLRDHATRSGTMGLLSLDDRQNQLIEAIMDGTFSYEDLAKKTQAELQETVDRRARIANLDMAVQKALNEAEEVAAKAGWKVRPKKRKAKAVKKVRKTKTKKRSRK